MKKKNNKKILL